MGMRHRTPLGSRRERKVLEKRLPAGNSGGGRHLHVRNTVFHITCKYSVSKNG